MHAAARALQCILENVHPLGRSLLVLHTSLNVMQQGSMMYGSQPRVPRDIPNSPPFSPAPGLNEELVQLLLIRDELHTEQDAMLVDIEDLTR